MGLSIAEVARDHRDYITETLQFYEQQLLPSSTEDEELVRRAVFSVRNKAIIFERYIPFSETLYSVVQDVRPAEVTIDFRRQQLTCSCPQKNSCRHQLGVILALSQYFISVQDWAGQWRAKKNIQLDTLAAVRSPENWQRMIDEVLLHTIDNKRQVEPILIPSIFENVRMKLRRHRPFEREWQPLYDLFIEVAMLKRLWEHLIHTNSPMQSDYFLYYLDKVFGLIDNAVSEIQPARRLFATEPFFDAIQHQVRAIALLERGAPHRRLALYLGLWENLFTEKKESQKELHFLESLPSGTSDIDLTALRSTFYILQSDDEQLQQTVRAINLANLETFIAIAHFALKKERQQGAELILKAALPFLKEYIHQRLTPMRRQQFTRLLDLLYSQIHLQEQEEFTLFSAYGKYGVQAFSTYLLAQQRYQDWVALHQLYPSSIPYLDSCGLKDVVANEPAVALPLYHYYAMGEIQQKSRLNYKQAVRIWRAMKSASKKAGKLDFFEAYLQEIQQQYKRLRALQEEIDKSNLIV
ncbi:MAG: hypothetical protein RR588_11145 [Solibacillus sp.]